ncbi:MAG: DNA repair protein RecN [Chloroflexi bacterium]|nr:DNA repair protein RecN [Chloroflexota bacterium]
MLVELNIANFAIIDRLTLAPAPGFNVLTGETGAGKSILIDAVGAILGGKVGAELVRAGAESARVEGIFDLRTCPTRDRIRHALLECGIEDDDDLILAREIHRSGRSTARVNGRAVPQAVLRELGERLVDVHGQSEHLSLLRAAEHVDILDHFAELLPRRLELAGLVAELRQVRRARQELVRDERELARRVDLLKFQIGEIEAAQLHPGEEDDLEAERRILGSAERLTQLSSQAYALLAEGGRTIPVRDYLGQVVSLLAELSRLDPALQSAHEAAESATYLVEDLARTLRSYRDGVEYNPARLAQIEERRDLIHNLKRKYGAGIREILAFGDQAQAELDGIAQSSERLAELTAREERLLMAIGERADGLSRERRRAAEGLARSVERELGDLNMAQVRFEVAIGAAEDPDGVPVAAPNGSSRRLAFDATGVDRIEFLIAPNPGEPLKPLARIASGGETSRLMLALKAILGRSDAVPMLIFDEIDVGIGGPTGLVVGQKLAGLAGNHQVVCVTHLPQTASYADVHFHIRKVVVQGRTSTVVERLDGVERVEELARMLGSATASTRQSAAEMMDHARAWIAAREKEQPCPTRTASASRPR